MYRLRISNKLVEKFHKMEKKNKKQLETINKKVLEIRENPHKFKSLSNIMKGFRRVHIDKSFVLIYSVDEQAKTVILEDYDHHDRIYRE